MTEGRKEVDGTRMGLRNEHGMMERKSWRFTYEALPHVHSLKLFLFNSKTPVPFRCVSLRAYLLPTSSASSSPVVVCQWKNPVGDSHTVFVPMPLCLIDHSVPFTGIARSDHIEITLRLLSFGGNFLDNLSYLGLTHKGVPIERDGGVKTKSPTRDESSFSLSSDTDLLTTKHSLSFYCRHCSAKLTKSISCFQALPSTDWRELADHWFEACCCINPAQSKSQMAQFEQLLTPTKGVCRVGSTTCITHCDDLVQSAVDQYRHISVDGGNIEIGESGSEMHQDDDAGMSYRKTNAKVAMSTEGQTWVDDVRLLSNPALTRNGSHHYSAGEPPRSASCGSGCVTEHGEILPGDFVDAKSSDHVAKAKTPANGFMSGPSTFSSSSNWTPFYCHSCSGLIGVSTGGKEEGVQLFKCHISSDLSPGGPSDVFRDHTLERVFSNELLSSAEEDSSYRYIIRGLKSKLPMLQLVLVNHESWNCSGSCLAEQSFLSDLGSTGPLISEDDPDTMVSPLDCQLMMGLQNNEFPPIFLEPVMKVMFRDATSFDHEKLSDVEMWAQTQQPDDIYMLESDVKTLVKSLQGNQKLLPESCAAFQQFHFSFLAR